MGDFWGAYSQWHPAVAVNNFPCANFSANIYITYLEKRQTIFRCIAIYSENVPIFFENDRWFKDLPNEIYTRMDICQC